MHRAYEAEIWERAGPEWVILQGSADKCSRIAIRGNPSRAGQGIRELVNGSISDPCSGDSVLYLLYIG